MATHTTDALVSEEAAQSSTSILGILESARERTGFDSYHAYLRFHNEDTTAFAQLCGPLRPLTDSGAETILPNSYQGYSAVLNLSEAGQLSIDEGHCYQEEGFIPGTDMVEALCFPPVGTRLQIAIWNASESGDCEVFGDLIGLHYRLDPVVLRAIDVSRAGVGFRHQRVLDRFAVTHAKVGQVVATLLHPLKDTNSLPLVLIAGPLSTPPPDIGWLTGALFKKCPPFNKSSTDDKKAVFPAPLRDQYNFYPKQLDQLLSTYYDTQTSIAECTLLCLLPLLHLSIVKVRHYLSVTRHDFEHPAVSRSEKMYNDRALLRTMINDLESDWWSIERYMKSCFRRELTEMRCYHDANSDVKDIVEEASHLESQVREHLQLQNGIKALEESKKSIEVSNQQIQEGKRGMYI